MSPPAQSRAQLQRLEEQLAAKDAEIAEIKAMSGAEIASLQAQVAAAKAANTVRPDTHDYDEDYTRDHYIDLLLREAGWPLDGEHDREFEVTGMPSPSGRGRIDYVLWGDDGKPLAVIEAKRAKRSASAGQQQAKLYADRLEEAYGQRPLIYYTNGFEHWFWDDTRYPPRQVQGFHTSDELHRDSTAQHLAAAVRGRDQLRDRRAPLPAARHPAHHGSLRARRRAQGARGHGHRCRQDPHRDRPRRPVTAVQLDQAGAVPRRPHRTGEPDGERVQSSDEDKAKWEELDWDEEGDIPTEVDADAVNKWLFNIDTADKVLETLMTRGITVAGGDHIGKTVIFAKNSAHADFVAERFNANYPEHRGSFARVITHQTEYAQSLIDDFSTVAKPPHIAISVDMLDTGIDVPEVVNLVFFKTVRSKTKFWQMIGRGTRLCPDLFAPGVDKTEFFIFDVCRNFEFFSQNPPTAEGSLAAPLSQRLFRNRLALLAGLDARTSPGGPVGEAERELHRQIADLPHGIVAGMNLDNFVVRPHQQLVQRYSNRAAWDNLDGDDIAAVDDRLSGLPSAERDSDEEAKRFDLLILRAQLCVLNAEPGFTTIRDHVRDIASDLLEQTSIPAVHEQAAFLEALAEEHWWDDVTLPMLDEARRRVRRLVRLIEKRKRSKVYTDFPDELGELTELPSLTGSGQVNGERFRAKVREFLRRHEDHIAIHKLRRNVALTTSDLAELERILVESGEFDQETLSRAAARADGLGLFVRSLVGLDRGAAVDALSGFLQGTAQRCARTRSSSSTWSSSTSPATVWCPPRSSSSPHSARSHPTVPM